MKNTILLFLFWQLCLVTYNQPVSVSEAEGIAQNFFLSRCDPSDSLMYINIKTKNYFEIPECGHTLLFIFNMHPTGWVMVAANRNIFPVPAYSPAGSYTGENLPPQFSAWINQYIRQIEYALEKSLAPLPESVSEWSRLQSSDPEILTDPEKEKEVLPMLISTWDQGQFYNQMCPSDPGGPAGHCYTGCVATAMGQICYFFRSPDTGVGSYSYLHPDYGTISANFGETAYNWYGMTNSVTEQNEAVAELLYHMGVSVDMDYGPDGSGMWNHKAAYSLRTYFKFDQQTQYLYRDSTSLDWDSVIVAHLDRGIPMYYAGWSVPNVNGHAFVCDGYQTTDYFHFNWGWGGSYDGYFYLDNLVPGGSNFNLAQELIINACPDSVNYTYPAYCTGQDTLADLNGTLDDGSGPDNDYENNADCSWLISPQTIEDSVTAVTIQFDKFETETSNDVLTVYDGETTASPVLGEFSGSSLPATLTSGGNKVLISFHSDDAGTAPGWFLSYHSIVPDWCSGMQLFTAFEDTLSDGSGSFFYQNGTVCMWNIQPPGATEVTLEFLEFETETDKDIVKIYDAGASQLLATYSGNYGGNLPDPVTSPSGKMLITFSSNGTVTAQGWTAAYEASVTGTEKYLGDRFSIYPNPFESSIIICKGSEPPYSIILTDLTGKELFRKTFTGSTPGQTMNIDLSGLTRGIYLMNLTNNSSHYLQKIVKVK